MKLRAVSVLFLASAALSACSDQQDASSLNDVSNPGNPGDRNTLFWVDQDQLHKGDCIQGRPTTRANCATNVQRSPVVETTSRAQQTAQSELTAAQAAVTQEVTKLKDADPTVVALKAEVQTLSQQKTSLDSAIRGYETSIADLNTSKVSLEEQIAYDDAQLAAVAAELQAKPNDADLLALQAALRDERADYSTSLATVNARIEAISARKIYDEATAADVATRLAERQARLTKVYGELVVGSERLDTLKAKQTLAEGAAAGIAPVVQLIAKSTITFRGNLLAPATQESLRIVSSALRPTFVLNPGRYEKSSGQGDYCPQKAEPTMSGSTLASVKLTYLSPCGGVSDVYTCQGNRCVARGNWILTVTDSTHYSYSGGSGLAQFQFIRADLEGQGDVNGPLNAIPAL